MIMNQQTPCFIVNLDSDTGRRRSMECALKNAGVRAEFFSALDGRLMSEEVLESHVDRTRAEREYGALARAEIGTSLSHIFIYREMVKRNLPYAVILEDDVCLDNGFDQLLQSGSANALESLFASSEPAMIQLSHVNRAYRWPVKLLGTTARSAVRPYGAVWLTSGYFITLAAAKLLAEGLYPVWAVADYWDRFQQLRLVRLWALTPNAVWESSEAQNSNISAERKVRRKSPKTLKSRLQRIGHELIVKPLLVRRLPKIST